MTGMTLSDYGCQFPEGFDSTMVFHINFGTDFAHITFGDNMSLINVVEMAGGYTNEEIENMDLDPYSQSLRWYSLQPFQPH